MRRIREEMIGFQGGDSTRFTPYRPRPLRIANTTLRWLDRSLGRVLTADAEALVARARQRAGSRDFGDDLHLEPLSILCEHLRDGPPMTAFGRLLLRADLGRRLENKLRIHAELARHPEILARRLRQPIFVLGLPRTGTTLLQRLLDADPESRSPRVWEMNEPVPPPRGGRARPDHRIRSFERAQRALDYAAPALKRMHESRADLPDECLPLMANGLVSGWYCFAWSSPYLRWFMAQDLEPAYRFHRQQLQILQGASPEPRWVLKAPWHLYGLAALLEVYPDARIVQTHRDPLEVLPSLASLLTTARAAVYEEVDPVAVGAEAAWRASRVLGAGLEARTREERRPSSRAVFQDVFYLDLVRDPIATVRKLYRGFGLELGPRAVESMQRHLAASPQRKYGKHRYRLEQFGLDGAEERSRYGAYCARFGL